MLEQKSPQKAWEGRPHHKKWGILKLIDEFFETFIDEIKIILNDMKVLDLKYDNAYGYIVLSLRGILVQLDGMKTLVFCQPKFLKKSE